MKIEYTMEGVDKQVYSHDKKKDIHLKLKKELK